MKKLLGIAVAAALALSMAACSSSSAGIYTPGTYTGEGNGMNGKVTATITVDDNNITAVELDVSGETPAIGGAAADTLIEQITEAQSADIEGVSGATYTSDGVKEAVAAAIAQAKGEVTEDTSTEYAVKDADVIVVGAGQTGMVAASRAAEMGSTVILFEQSDTMGGAGRYAGGYISGANTELQAAAGIEDSAELFYKDLARIGGEGNNNQELAWVHAQRSGELVDWVTDTLGVKLSEPGFGAYTPTDIARVYITENGGQDYITALSDYMAPYIEDGTITVYMSTEVTDLVMEDGEVTGVVAAGETFTAKGGVILATGGYGYNEEWVEEYNFAHSRSQSPATSTGSGFTLAASAGAGFSNMEYLPAYPGALDNSDDTYSVTCTANTSGWTGAIWVDLNGNRLCDEVGFTVADRQATWANAEENYVYIVFTQEMRDEAETPILSTDATNGNWDYFDAQLDEGYCVFSGSSVEEAAQAAGIDAEGLKATIEKYNGYVAAGEDADFGRTEQLEEFADETTYYIVRTVPYILLTKGGVDVNTAAECLTEDGTVIPGLYAAGETIGGANLGGHNSYGGLACCATFTFGTIAAESAVSRATGVETHVEGYTPVSTELPQ